MDNIEAAHTEFKANGFEISGFKIEQNDGVKWKVFYIIAPDRLCYWIGERQSDAQA